MITLTSKREKRWALSAVLEFPWGCIAGRETSATGLTFAPEIAILAKESHPPDALAAEVSEDTPMPESGLQNQVERAPGGQFVKGQSGNPAGKPAGCRIMRRAPPRLARRRSRGADPQGRHPRARRGCLGIAALPRSGHRAASRPSRAFRSAADRGHRRCCQGDGGDHGGGGRRCHYPREGAAVARVVDAHVRAVEASDFDRRLKALEAAHAADL